LEVLLRSPINEELKVQSNYVISSKNFTLPEAFRADRCAGLTSRTISFSAFEVYILNSSCLI